MSDIQICSQVQHGLCTGGESLLKKLLVSTVLANCYRIELNQVRKQLLGCRCRFGSNSVSIQRDATEEARGSCVESVSRRQLVERSIHPERGCNEVMMQK